MDVKQERKMSARKNFIALVSPFIVFLLAFAAGKAQSNIDGKLLCREWVLDRGWFPEDSIAFRSPKRGDSKHIYSTVRFLESGNLTYELHVPKGVGLCGNGLLYLDEAFWKISDDQTLTIYLKGIRLAESKF